MVLGWVTTCCRAVKIPSDICGGRNRVGKGQLILVSPPNSFGHVQYSVESSTTFLCPLYIAYWLWTWQVMMDWGHPIWWTFWWWSTFQSLYWWLVTVLTGPGQLSSMDLLMDGLPCGAHLVGVLGRESTWFASRLQHRPSALHGLLVDCNIDQVPSCFYVFSEKKTRHQDKKQHSTQTKHPNKRPS